MKRREFVLTSLAGVAGIPHIKDSINGLKGEAQKHAQGTRSQAGKRSAVSVSKKLFPADNGSGLEWTQFSAAGFSRPACGVIYNRTQRPKVGMPLGGIDTGRLDLDPDAAFGVCSIFNSIVPRRGPLRLPFLGMTVGKQVWVLSDPYPRDASGSYMWAGVQTPTEIHYWGHYPVADLEYDLQGSPVGVGLRAWATFLPGDSATSNTPGAVFEVHLRNLSNTPQQGRLAFSFPGPTQAEAQISADSPRERGPSNSWVAIAPESVRALRQQVKGTFSGVVVSSEKVKEIGYALGVIGDTEVVVGGGLAPAGSPYLAAAWAKIGRKLPKPQEEDFSSSVSIGYRLQPKEEKTVRFVLAWYAPMWIGEGRHTYTHMYTTRYKNALEVAQFLSREHDSLLRRILAWQEVVYTAQNLPIWLRDSLVNIFHLFAGHSLWAMARPPIGPWCRPSEGLFGILQLWSGIEIISDAFYADIPVPLFFPDLALSSLRGFKAYQFANGAAVRCWGGNGSAVKGGYKPTAPTEFASPTPGYQTTVNGPSYAALVDRYLQRTGNGEVLREFYPSLKKNTIYTMNLRPEDGADGIISVPSGDVDPYSSGSPVGLQVDWWGSFHFRWFGMSVHAGGFHLAQLRTVQRMAEQAGDKEFAERCRKWFEQGSQSMENKMWAGEYYLRYNEPKTGRKSDSIFAYQLDGEWMARYQGLPGVFRNDRVKTTLNTIKRTCVAATPYGAVNLTHPDGSLVQQEGVHGGDNPFGFYVSEVPFLAMTYMYEGEREFGLELARRCVYDVTINLRLAWSQPNIIRGDNGERIFGTSLPQNMNLWALPAAIEGNGIAAFCRPGGLVDRIIQAAK